MQMFSPGTLWTGNATCSFGHVICREFTKRDKMIKNVLPSKCLGVKGGAKILGVASEMTGSASGSSNNRKPTLEPEAE